MKKIEFVWRELLDRVIEKGENTFTISEIAQRYALSTSVVDYALSPLKALNIVKIGKFSSQIVDWERLLFFWATKRNLKKDIIYSTYSDLDTLQREAYMPEKVIPTAYTAFRLIFKYTPSDYDTIYFYSTEIELIKKRFPPKKGDPNIFILQPDKFLERKGEIGLAQLFVDLWNLPEWYSKDFQDALLLKIKEKLGT